MWARDLGWKGGETSADACSAVAPCQRMRIPLESGTQGGKGRERKRLVEELPALIVLQKSRCEPTSENADPSACGRNREK